MHPAVPPVFRRKANTLQADNGALPYQTTAISFDMLRREMRPLSGIRRLQPCQRSLEYLFTDLLTSSSHDDILYHNLFFFSILFSKKRNKKQNNIENKSPL